MIRTASVVLFLSQIFLGSYAYAASPNPWPVNTIISFAIDAAEISVQIGLTLALVVFGWGIIKFISAAQNPKKIQEAKQIMLWGVIGIFILASLFGIVEFINTYFGIGAGNPIEPPRI